MKVFYVFSILSLLILASCSASVDTPKFDPVKKTEVDTPKLQEFQISSNDQEMVNKIVMNNPQKMSETFEFMFAPQAMTAAELSSYTYDTTGCFPDEYQIYMKWVRLNPSDNEVLSEEVVNYGMKIQAEPAYAYKLSVNIVGADRCSKFYFKFIFRGTEVEMRPIATGKDNAKILICEDTQSWAKIDFSKSDFANHYFSDVTTEYRDWSSGDSFKRFSTNSIIIYQNGTQVSLGFSNPDENEYFDIKTSDFVTAKLIISTSSKEEEVNCRFYQ